MPPAAIRKSAVGEAVLVVEGVRMPESFPPKWDLAAPLPDGWTADMLRELLDRAGLIARIGEDNVYPPVRAAVTASPSA